LASLRSVTLPFAKPTAGLGTTQKRYRRSKAANQFWLSTLPEDTSIKVIVDAAKVCWRVECDYEELKSEPGLAYFVRLARMPSPRYTLHRVAQIPDLLESGPYPSGLRRLNKPDLSDRPGPKVPRPNPGQGRELKSRREGD
jgi:hypothetical protein